MRYRVITIEREYASGGNEIGEKLAKKLGLPCHGHSILLEAAAQLNLPPERLMNVEENMTGSLLYSLAAFTDVAAGGETDYMPLDQKLTFAESGIIRDLAKDPCVLIGRGACALLKDRDDVLRVFIHADQQFRADRAAGVYGVDPKQAESVLRRQDKRRSNYFRVTTKTDWKDADLYHLFVNSGKLGLDAVVDVLYGLVQ